MPPARILVLDDDPSLLRTIRLILDLEGFTVETAVDGVEGLEQVAADGFDLILLDLQMPRMDGRTFHREIRSRGYMTPVLILSAYGAEAAKEELGAEGAVHKPFDPDLLVGRIREMLPQAAGS